MQNKPFAPFQSLATELITHLPGDQADGSHDLSHIHRVWKNVCRIQAVDGGNLQVLLAATILHDCVVVEKNSPLRSSASTLSAEKAELILLGMGWPAADIALAAGAIKAHSYSAGIEPETLEAKILQDADRLDALGAVGVARCFYVSGRLGRTLYDFENPHAADREYDDSTFAIEHFHTKLLKLNAGFRTGEGARLAQVRHDRLESFLDEFMEEVGI